MTLRPGLVYDWLLIYDWLHSESYVATDGQSASLSWNKAPIWGLRPDFYYCQTVAGLLMWDALSHERTGLSITIAAGPRQRSHSRVRVPWDSQYILLPQIRDFPFRRHLRLAGIRWRYSTPPPHGMASFWSERPLHSVSVSKEMFVDYSYTRKRSLGFLESTSVEMCLSTFPSNESTSHNILNIILLEVSS
jgi:hypothetical protein